MAELGGPSRPRHLALVGPTASGKSAIGHALALLAGDIEIVSVDSMQVYRGMDIGTAKPSPAEQAEVRYHLIDQVDPHEDYTVGRYARSARKVIADIEARGNRALLVGGTGLYLRAVVDDLQIPPPFPELRDKLEQEPDTAVLLARLAELDPTATTRMEATNRRRIVRALEVCLGTGQPFSSFGPGLTSHGDIGFDLVALLWPRPLLDQRISERYDAQLRAGFLDEVAALAALDPPMSPTARQALGYRELLGHLAGATTLGEALELARLRTRQFARRQERWFRRDPRIRWLDLAERAKRVDHADSAAGDSPNPVVIARELLRDWSGSRTAESG